MRTILTVKEASLYGEPFKRVYRFEWNRDENFVEFSIPERVIQSLYPSYSDERKGLIVAVEYLLQLLREQLRNRDSLHEGDRQEDYNAVVNR